MHKNNANPATTAQTHPEAAPPTGPEGLSTRTPTPHLAILMTTPPTAAPGHSRRKTPALPSHRTRAGRQVPSIGESHKGGVNVGGAAGLVEDADYKALPQAPPPGGATPPADEQPASEASEIDLDPDMTGPGHVAGSLDS